VIGNVIFALGAKGVFIVLAGMGMANMWVALIADVGVALVAILNSARALGGGTLPRRADRRADRRAGVFAVFGANGQKYK